MAMASFWGASGTTRISLEDSRRFSRASGRSKAASLPLAMMSTWSQMVCTSERMWELKITVCCLPSSRISSRNSMIWMGSRPTVGSSRMMALGLPSRAWAMPTRWR